MRRIQPHHILLGLFLVYAGAFIARTSFVVEGRRYFCLFDDAMISMRYARNLIHGHGLVWNPGEARVEGITNPLWTLFMSACHLLPISAAKISLAVQISGALLLLLNLVWVRRLVLALRPGAEGIALAAMVLTGAYLPLNNWALQGMEVGAIALLVTAAVTLFIRNLPSGGRKGSDSGSRPVDRKPYLWLALSTWIRPDMAVLALGLTVLTAFLDRPNRRARLRTGLCLIVAAVALQTVIRLAYYGDPLPNTYYLKVAGYPPGLRVLRGLLVYGDFLSRMSWVPFLLAVAAPLLTRNRGCILLLGAFLLQSVYSISVGGDAWEWWGGANRYLCAGISLFFVLLALSVDDLIARTWKMPYRHPIPPIRQEQRSLPPPPDKRRPAGHAVFAVAIAVVLLLVANQNHMGALRQWALLSPPLHVPDNREMVRMSRVLDRLTEPEARIAVVWAGIVPYFTGRPGVDLLGKNDRHLAHLQVAPSEDPRAFVPGHIKYDYGYSIGTLCPDVVSDLVGEESEARPVLFPLYRRVVQEGFVFYLRVGSPEVRWPRVAAGG